MRNELFNDLLKLNVYLYFFILYTLFYHPYNYSFLYIDDYTIYIYIYIYIYSDNKIIVVFLLLTYLVYKSFTSK